MLSQTGQSADPIFSSPELLKKLQDMRTDFLISGNEQGTFIINSDGTITWSHGSGDWENLEREVTYRGLLPEGTVGFIHMHPFDATPSDQDRAVFKDFNTRFPSMTNFYILAGGGTLNRIEPVSGSVTTIATGSSWLTNPQVGGLK